MMRCDRIFVEGQTDVTILENLFPSRKNIRVHSLGGKGNVIREFKEDVDNDIKSASPPLQSGNVCYIIDGDCEGYDFIFNNLAKELRGLSSEPPYIKRCIDDLCRVLIVIGEEREGYRGCVESMLWSELSSKMDKDLISIVNSIVEYKARQSGLTLCDKAKLRFYLTIFLLSDDPTTLYLTRNFVNELFRIVGIDKIRDIYGKFLDLSKY